MLVIVVYLVKKAVIGKRLAHAVRTAPVMAWIHAGFVVVIIQAVQIVLVCHALMRMKIIAVYVMIFQKMTVCRIVRGHGVVLR